MRAIRALAALDAAPFALVFGGGTALARAHRLVRRMSEDVDFKIVPLPAAPVSRSGLHRQRSALRGRVTAALPTAGFTFDPKNPAQARSRDESSYMVWQLPYSPPAGAGEGLRPRRRSPPRRQQIHEQRRRGQERHWAEAFRRRPTVSRRRAARPGNRARVASAGDQGTRAVLAVRVMVSSDCSVRDTRSVWDCAGHCGNLELPHGPLRPSATAGCRTHAFPAAATGRAGRIPALSARCTRGRRKCCLC